MSDYPKAITLCGFGGQGIVLSAVVLGECAVTKCGLYAVQTASYGSEARGGQCQSALIVDNKPVGSPISEKCDILISMFQSAYDKYIDTLAKDGTLVVDPDMVQTYHDWDGEVLEIPATHLAVELGNRMAANMVMLGFIAEALGIVPVDKLTESVIDNVNPKFLELNKKAVMEGVNHAKKLREEGKIK